MRKKKTVVPSFAPLPDAVQISETLPESAVGWPSTHAGCLTRHGFDAYVGDQGPSTDDEGSHHARRVIEHGSLHVPMTALRPKHRRPPRLLRSSTLSARQREVATVLALWGIDGVWIAQFTALDPGPMIHRATPSCVGVGSGCGLPPVLIMLLLQAGFCRRRTTCRCVCVMGAIPRKSWCGFRTSAVPTPSGACFLRSSVGRGSCATRGCCAVSGQGLWSRPGRGRTRDERNRRGDAGFDSVSDCDAPVQRHRG